ncbi:MAG: Hsp20/alpha crystallin family protein [Verrucomicrobia bacterium]|nr:Hsp20/alpha crystallin family protein [Verrucomicrobiota bacterium]
MYSVIRTARNPWSIFNELESLQDEFNRAFSGRRGPGSSSGRNGSYPAINVWSGRDGLVLDAELPGADPKEIEVSVTADELTLRGKTIAQGPAENETLHRSERSSGEFSRVLQLPFRADGDAVKASYKNGILRVHVARPQAEKPRQIKIEAE